MKSYFKDLINKKYNLLENRKSPKYADEEVILELFNRRDDIGIVWLMEHGIKLVYGPKLVDYLSINDEFYYLNLLWTYRHKYKFSATKRALQLDSQSQCNNLIKKWWEARLEDGFVFSI